MEFDSELNAEILYDLLDLHRKWKRAKITDKFKLISEIDKIKKKMLFYISDPIKRES